MSVISALHPMERPAAAWSRHVSILTRKGGEENPRGAAWITLQCVLAKA